MHLKRGLAVGIVAGLVAFFIATQFVPAYATGGCNSSGGGPCFNLSGVITDLSTGKPISGALVVASATLWPPTPATTNSAGWYQIPSLPSGITYTIGASAQGYVSSAVTVSIPVTTTSYVLNFALVSTIGPPPPPPPGSITVSGTVTVAITGSPVNGALISVTNSNIVATAYSNANGLYSLSVPNPGTYNIKVNLSGYVSQTASFTANGNPVTVNFSLQSVSNGRFVLPSGTTIPLLAGFIAGGVGFVIGLRGRRRA